MKLTDEQEKRFGKTLEHIESTGWTVMLISPSANDPEDIPRFAYTIGLWHNYTHPELLVWGLDPDLMHAMLNVAGEEIRDDGRVLSDSAPESGLLGGDVDVIPRRVRSRWHPAVVGYGLDVYELLDGPGGKLPVLQLLWPGAVDRYFPWEEDADEVIKHRQPLLYLDDPNEARVEVLEEWLRDVETNSTV